MTPARRLRRCAIWKRTSSAKDIRTVSDNIKSYLDETTKKPDRVMGEVDLGKSTWLTEGVEYLTKEEKGRLRIYGFLREDVMRMSGQLPHQLSNADRVHLAEEAWIRRWKDRNIKTTCHKFVLSLNPELCEQLRDAGISADEVLTEATRMTLRRYQEKFYPNEKLGYLVGLHHDKKHIHAHVMLFPTSESGKLLRITDEGRSRGDRKPFTFLREFSTKFIQDFYEREIVNPQRASERTLDSAYLPKLLSRAASLHVDPNVSDEERWTKTLDERRRLESLPPEELQRELYKAYERERETYKKLQASMTPEKVLRTQNRFRDNSEDIKQEMANVFADLKALNNEKHEAFRKRRELLAGMSAWTFLRSKNFNVLSGGFGPRTEKARKDLMVAAARNPTFARMLDAELSAAAANSDRQRTLQETQANIASFTKGVRAYASMMEEDPEVKKVLKRMTESAKDGKFLSTYNRFLKATDKVEKPMQDFVREFFKAELKLAQEQDQIMAQRKKVLQDKLESLRIRSDLERLDEMLLTGQEKKRLPQYLAQFEGWMQTRGRSATSIPVDTLVFGVRSKVEKELDRKAQERLENYTPTTIVGKMNQMLLYLKNNMSGRQIDPALLTEGAFRGLAQVGSNAGDLVAVSRQLASRQLSPEDARKVTLQLLRDPSADVRASYTLPRSTNKPNKPKAETKEAYLTEKLLGYRQSGLER